MRIKGKLGVIALAVMALFVALAATSSARQLESSNQQVRVVFTPAIFRAMEGSTISCTVTLEGSFHSRTISKIAETLMGYITRAIVNTPGCRSAGIGTGIKVEALGETLPWHVRYVDFSGALPNARPRARILNTQSNFLVIPLVGTCRYRGNLNAVVTGPAGGGINEGSASLTAEEGVVYRSETAFCPEGTFTARAPVWLLGTTTGVTVRLI